MRSDHGGRPCESGTCTKVRRPREMARRDGAGTGIRLTGLLRNAAVVLLLMLLPASARAQARLWVGTLGNDTSVVEESRQTGSRITGTIVNVAAGMLLQRYEADLDEAGRVRAFRSWSVRDLAAPLPADQTPTVNVEIGSDSIHVTRAGRNGPELIAVPAIEGATPVFDAFFSNPMALMDLALRQARDRGDGKLRLYYIGAKQVEDFPLTDAGGGVQAFPYYLARQYPMLTGARFLVTMGPDGMTKFDAGETTFKIVTQPHPWSDPVALAASFKERRLGAGGFNTMSPPAKATGQVGGVDIEVTYGQPSRRGRNIFPDVVPFGDVWRAGANAATQVTFSADVMVAETHVPAGSYSVWMIPGESADTLILNKATRIWGVMYDAEQDLARIPLKRDPMSPRVETLTYSITEESGRGTLALTWDDRRFSVNVRPAMQK